MYTRTGGTGQLLTPCFPYSGSRSTVTSACFFVQLGRRLKRDARIEICINQRHRKKIPGVHSI